jgi:hypothetical protein
MRKRMTIISKNVLGFTSVQQKCNKSATRVRARQFASMTAGQILEVRKENQRKQGKQTRRGAAWQLHTTKVYDCTHQKCMQLT